MVIFHSYVKLPEGNPQHNIQESKMVTLQPRSNNSQAADKPALACGVSGSTWAEEKSNKEYDDVIFVILIFIWSQDNHLKIRSSRVDDVICTLW